jgi:hypothetical protein
LTPRFIAATPVNDTYALPREFYGLSYEYVTGRLHEIAPAVAAERLIVAQLGNGASMCAIRNGVSVNSTRCFTALDGLPMGTGCGQLDPGVVLYLTDERGLGTGDRGPAVSPLGPERAVRPLEAAGTPEAIGAIDYFVYRIRRELGAMAAVLSGLDVLAPSSGGIGENAARVRERLCADCAWLGIELDHDRNRAGETIISSHRSRVRRHSYQRRTDDRTPPRPPPRRGAGGRRRGVIRALPPAPARSSSVVARPARLRELEAADVGAVGSAEKSGKRFNYANTSKYQK